MSSCSSSDSEEEQEYSGEEYSGDSMMEGEMGIGVTEYTYTPDTPCTPDTPYTPNTPNTTPPNSKNIEKIPQHLIYYILSLLPCKDLIYPIMLISRYLHALANTPSLMTKAFFSTLLIPPEFPQTDFLDLSPKDKYQMIKSAFHGGTKRLPLFAYYTDGGTYSKEYFVHNIFIENPVNLFSSSRGENVNIKGVCSRHVLNEFKMGDLGDYQVGTEGEESNMENINKKEVSMTNTNTNTNTKNTKDSQRYKIPISDLISKHDTGFDRSFGILKYYDLNRNIYDYTCYLQSFALFVSMNEISSTHPIVQLFTSLNSFSHFQDFGFPTIPIQSEGKTQVVEIDLSSRRKVEDILRKYYKGARLDGVYPLIYANLVNNTANYLNLQQKIGFRFILMKLIDSDKTSGNGNNIDCYSITPSGTYIQLRNSCED